MLQQGAGAGQAAVAGIICRRLLADLEAACSALPQAIFRSHLPHLELNGWYKSKKYLKKGVDIRFRSVIIAEVLRETTCFHVAD